MGLNRELAAGVLREAYRKPSMSPVHACDIMVDALQENGLLMPGLPEPESVRESRTAFWFDGDVYAHEGSGKIRVMVEDSRYLVESARELALSILAACEHAEKGQGNESRR